MKYPYTGSSFTFLGISRDDLIGLGFIALIGLSGLYLSNPLLLGNADSGISQPTKHSSAAALNSEKTAKLNSKSTITSATHTAENTKM